MPKIAEERRNSAAEEPLPQYKSCQQSQIVADPQIPPADAEEGKEPAKKQLHADDSLAQTGQSGTKGPETIHRGSQCHAAQEAAQKPLPDQSGRHRRRPRFRRGSS